MQVVIQVFIAMCWDYYYCLRRKHNNENNEVSSLCEELKNNFGFLFTQQKRKVPNLNEMVKELSQINPEMDDYFCCVARKEFIEKYSGSLL